MQPATAGSSVAPSFTAGGAKMSSAELIVLLFAVFALIVIVATDDFGGPA